MNRPDTIFFPGLNGLRAIAALAVVLSHITILLDEFNLNNHLLGTLPNGNPRGLDLSDFGVSIFFALSGFLITFLLLAERQHGGINVKNFYIRRILRIWPLYYLYYLLAIAVIYFWEIPHPGFTGIFYVFFMANVPKILQLKSELLGHYWSLGVEEQFYIFWPLIVKKMYAKPEIVTGSLLGGTILLKGAGHFIFPGTLFETAMYTNRFDCMLIGGIGAIYLFKHNEYVIRLLSNVFIQFIAWFMVLGAALNKFHIASIFDHEFMAIITVTLIVGQATTKSIINLQTRTLDFLGKISYGIYVIHPLVIFLLAKSMPDLRYLPGILPYLLVYGCAVGLVIVAAYLSYQYFEKPFLRRKPKYSTIHTAPATG